MLSLGIDIGTNKTAVAVIDTNSKSVFTKAVEHCAQIPDPDVSEQNPKKHLEVVVELVKQIPKELRKNIRSVGICGQMHGIMLWNNENTSNLITWQDQRGTREGKLEELKKIPGCSKLKDGFGFTTLACYDERVKYKYCGTIQDFVVWTLTGAQSPVFIDTTDAASWGLWNDGSWNLDTVRDLGIDCTMLPTIVPVGAPVGNMSSDWKETLEVGNGAVSLIAAVGDNQASVFGSGQCPEEEVYVTIGTGTQMSVAVDPKVIRRSPNEKYELRPFVDGQMLAVIAPLCGGEAWNWLKNTVTKWLSEMGAINQYEYDVFGRIDELSAIELDSHDLPRIEPHFLGERWDEFCRGSISGITLTNFSVGKVGAALALGIARNLRDNIPDDFVQGKKVVIASGNAIRKSVTIRNAISKTFGLPVMINNTTEEAAIGAAKLSYKQFKHEISCSQT